MISIHVIPKIVLTTRQKVTAQLRKIPNHHAIARPKHLLLRHILQETRSTFHSPRTSNHDL